MILVDGEGTLRDSESPLLYADDLAVLRGDGIFETMLVRGGRARLVDEHLDRFARSAERMDLVPPDRSSLVHAVRIAERAWAASPDGGPDRDAALRVVCSRGRESEPDAGPTCFLTVKAVAARGPGGHPEPISVLSLLTSLEPDVVRDAPWDLAGVKALSYARNMSALRHAQASGADDVIFVSPSGAVLEGPTSSVVAVIDGTLVTTPHADGVLPGTTQSALFAVARHHGLDATERRMRVADLVAADGVWLVSSVRLAARVGVLDGVDLPMPSTGAPDVPHLVEQAIGDGPHR